MESIPTAVCLTAYAGESEDFITISPGRSRRGRCAQVGRVFTLDEIVEARRLMEENKASGKIVVLT
jgi:hypothetical protein